jgi:hypothetical protein
MKIYRFIERHFERVAGTALYIVMGLFTVYMVVTMVRSELRTAELRGEAREQKRCFALHGQQEPAPPHMKTKYRQTRARGQVYSGSNR